MTPPFATPRSAAVSELAEDSTPEALRTIFQQRKFTSLEGSAEPMGDLKSIVLHNLEITHVKSTFPIALGARISAVDDSTFSSTGEAFSHIILPESQSTRVHSLQADDVSLGALLPLTTKHDHSPC